MFFKKLRTIGSIAVFALILTTLSFATNQTARGVEPEIECRPASFIYARGSGQEVNNSKEISRFQDALEKSLPKSLYSLYELGTISQNSYRYPAINVADLRNGNAIGAATSGGLGNDYGRSVSDGVLELKSYLETTNSTCPGTFFILGGYSQGAQVIGQALPLLNESVVSKIVFSGLFGDPKLHLPEGKGLIPPACRGENLSVYRRDIANCRVDRGSLGSRIPYLPSSLAAKTGLWCYAGDFVCGSSKIPSDTSGHGKYGNDGMAIDKAVAEAVTLLKKALPKDLADTIKEKDSDKVDTAADVVYVIDTTGSMWGQIESTKRFAAESAANIIAKDGRVALVAYKDLGDSYTAKIVSGFSSDPAVFQSGLSTLYAEGGGDTPEALLHALMTAFNGLDWKYGATKAAVVLTDAGFHNPDLVDGSTLAKVVQRSLEIDPVNVYAVVPDYVKPEYQEITSQTSGQVIVDSGDTVAALNTALTKIQTRPVVTLPLDTYIAEAGQSVTFNASVTLPADVSISSYDWDFDGDGTFDQTTSAPTNSHIYSSQFDGFMQVRANASNDTIGSASAKVEIGIFAPEPAPESPTNLVATVTSTKDHKSTVKLSWTLPSKQPDHYVLTLNGIGLGTLAPERTAVDILEIDRTIDNEIGLIGAAADGTEGVASSIVVEKESPATTPPPTNTKPIKSLLSLLLVLIKKLLSYR